MCTNQGENFKLFTVLLSDVQCRLQVCSVSYKCAVYVTSMRYKVQVFSVSYNCAV